MGRTPKPWWWKARRIWAVTIAGKRHMLGPDKEAADRKFHALMAKPKPQRVAADSVYAIIDSFLEWTQKHRAPRTYEWYHQRLQWFVETIPNLSADEFRPFHVQQWVDAHPNWSDGHKRGCMTAVQRAFRWAEKQGHIDRSPIAHLEKPKQGTRERVISADEFKSILAVSHGQEFRDLLYTAWETGARPQELIRVESRHVDLKGARWVFPKEEAKVKTRPRIVYLTECALEITKRYTLKHPDGPIFRNSKSRPWTPYAINCRFEQVCIRFGRQRMQQLGIERSAHEAPRERRCQTEKLARQHGTKYCLYNFRHSFATRLLEAGVDSLTVAILLGHQDPGMLARVYQHLSHNPKHLLEQVRQAAG